MFDCDNLLSATKNQSHRYRSASVVRRDALNCTERIYTMSGN